MIASLARVICGYGLNSVRNVSDVRVSRIGRRPIAIQKNARIGGSR